MSRQDFDTLVNDLERRFAARPWALTARGAMIVALGYTGVLIWGLSIGAFGIAGFVAAPFVPVELSPFLILGSSFALALAAWQAVQVLWSPLEKRKGCHIRLEQYPALHELMSRLRRSLKTPRIHEIVLSCQMNAGIQQHPRLGILGWSYNVLHLGLPLMEMLSPSEFESVLAHECAHLSARHGRFFTWIYRVRGTWEDLFRTLHEPPKSGFSRFFRRGLCWFIDWYWPRFHAYLFVLSRSHEYVADRCAVDWVGAEATASALWRIELCYRRLEQKFWNEVTLWANVEPEPPADITTRLLTSLASAPSADDRKRWIDQAISSITDNSDTHPSLTDRLSAFGVNAATLVTSGFPVPPANSAAQHLFGEQHESIRQAVDRQWREDVRETWRARHGQAAVLQRRIGELDQVAAQTAADVAVLWDKARSVLALEGEHAAVPLLCQLLELRPRHAAANLALGRHLLQQGRHEGIDLVRCVLEDPENDLIPEACSVLAQHYQSTGQTQQLKDIYNQLSRYQEAVADAQRERCSVTAHDQFLPHDLPADKLDAMLTLLSAHSELAEAYLVRKQLRHFTHQQLFVLCVRTQPGFFGRSNADRDATLVSKLIPQVRLPGRVLIIAPQHGFKRVARKIMSLPESRILPQQKTPTSLS